MVALADTFTSLPIKQKGLEAVVRAEKARPFFEEMPADQRIAEMKSMADYIKANGSSSDRAKIIGYSLPFPHLMRSRDLAAESFFKDTLAIYTRVKAQAQTIRLGAEGREIGGVWYALGAVGLLAAVTAWRNR